MTIGKKQDQMKTTLHNISTLYGDHPKLYNAIANDRNFELEVNDIISHLGFLPEVALETFSGEAQHARQLYAHGVVCYALDRSKGMQLESFAPVKFEVAELPDALDLFNDKIKFDLILAMRFGIGHLNPDQLKMFLHKAKSILSDRGVIALEIHRNIKLGHQFKELEILERKTQTDEYGEIKCSWPYGSIGWHGNKAIMQVKVSYTKPALTTLFFEAPEFIYDESYVISEFEALDMEACVYDFSSYSKLILANATNVNPR